MPASPVRTDLALSGLATLFSVVEALAGDGSPVGLLRHSPLPDAAVSVLLGLATLARRRFPRWVAAIVVIGDWLAYTPLILALAVFTIGVYCKPAWSWLVASCTLALNAMTSTLTGDRPLVSFVAQALVFLIAPAIAGTLVRERRQQYEQITVRAERLEQSRARDVEDARREERTRIAREVHDVVAHRITQVVLLTGALELNAARGPAWVTEQAARIRGSGTQALDELQDVVRVLRAAGAPQRPALEPQHSIADLPALVAQTRALGSDVSLTLTGEMAQVRPSAQRTVFRLVQETLTNAAKHAPGAPVSVLVELRTGNQPRGDTITVTVRNGPPSGARPVNVPTGGHGLIGLAERVRLHGGRFRHEHTGDGGFLVTASIPTHPADESPEQDHQEEEA
ncbi:sensor histidine kinase [Streptomyces sp. NPDC059002]|uniref:sensor histidine kinase n=1 Tax=Streptomyces sp. NPDC059002 TaxID=3346690 RepID=UPI00367E5C8D